MSNLKLVRDVVIAVVLVVAVAAGLSELGYRIFQHYAPRHEQVRRETFQQSQEYNEGVTRHLYELRRQYLEAPDAGSKSAIRDMFIHEADGYPNQLPADLQSFKYSLVGQ